MNKYKEAMHFPKEHIGPVFVLLNLPLSFVTILVTPSSEVFSMEFMGFGLSSSYAGPNLNV